MAAIIGAAAVAVALASAGTAAADPFGWWATQPHPFAVHADRGVAGPNGTVTGNLLANSGVVDDGEVLEVNVAKLPPVLGTATVTLRF